MLTRKNFYPFIFAFIFIGGCVPPQESASLQNEIITLKNQLRSAQARLDVATESEKNTNKKIDTLTQELSSVKRNQADIKTEIDDLSENDQILKAKLDEFDYKTGLLSKEISAIKTKSIPGETVKGSQDKEIAMINPTEIYKTSYNDYVKGNYDLAISGFQEFVKKFPDSELAGNAQYWIGESFYSLQDFDKAAVEFDKVITNYPNNRKIASAMLKKGYSYLRLGKDEKAKELFIEVTRKFPQSVEAKLAEQKLKVFEKKGN
jgi:tol-pal system protein YbgF